MQMAHLILSVMTGQKKPLVQKKLDPMKSAMDPLLQSLHVAGIGVSLTIELPIVWAYVESLQALVLWKIVGIDAKNYIIIILVKAGAEQALVPGVGKPV